MRISKILAAVSLLLFASAAFGDSFQFSVSSNQELGLSSPNDNFWGYYTTGVDGFGTTSEVLVDAAEIEPLNLTSSSFFLPAGSTITSASLELVLPMTRIQGTSEAFVVTSEPVPPPNPNDPLQIAPTFGNPGTAYLYPVSNVNGVGSAGGGVFDLSGTSLVVDGNEVSTGNLLLELDEEASIGGMEAIVGTQGYNFAGYVDADGEVDLPYTLEVVGTYTPPVPEPSGMVLLATGIVALITVAHSRGWIAC